MKLNIKVKANAKQDKVEKISNDEFILWVREPATEGKANTAVIEALSKYFDLAKSRITIIRGQKNKRKVIEVI
ncbi:MAG: DUF167 domain-containing protein [Candidatus Omnitrophica bacterium]|nr:DUF167 domain-containing protein [Candidatus Omnitrophota bacterium]